MNTSSFVKGVDTLVMCGQHKWMCAGERTLGAMSPYRMEIDYSPTVQVSLGAKSRVNITLI